MGILKELSNFLGLKNSGQNSDIFFEPTSFLGKTYATLGKNIHHLNEYLPYMAYDEQKEIYINNNNTKSVIFETVPRIIAGDSTPFESIMDRLPQGATLQIMLYGSPNITSITDLFLRQAIGTQNNALYNSLAHEYVNFLENNTKKSINDIMLTCIKHSRMFVSITFTAKHDDIVIDNTISTVKNILDTKKFYPEKMHPDEFVKLLFEIFNMNHDFRYMPGYDAGEFINKQVLAPDSKISIKVTDDYFTSDDIYWTSIDPTYFPKKTHIFEFGKKLGDYMSLNIDKQQFYDPFIITANISRLTDSQINTIRITKTIPNASIKMDERMFTKQTEKRQDAEHANKKFDEKTPAVNIVLNILISARSYEGLRRNADTVKTYWSSGSEYERYIMFPHKHIMFLDFLSALPFVFSKDYMNFSSSDKTLFYDEASHFIPAEADWAGSERPTVPLISRRGQITAFDLFDSPTNYNGYIVATPGAGKSVLINLITTMHLLKNDKIFIFDIGRSYSKLTESMDGQWIEFDDKKPMCLNPFSEIKTEYDLIEYMDYLIDFIWFIGAPSSQTMSAELYKFVRSYIETATKELWDANKDNLEVTHFSEWFIARAMSDGDQRLKDFGQQLKPYTKTGRFGKFFSGKSEVNFNKQLVVMEIDNIESTIELRDAVMMIMMFHISRSIYLSGTHKERTLVFIDEAHRFLGTSPNIDVFIEQAYRRFRKHNASIIIATQGFNDIYSAKETPLTRAGRVIIDSSAWKFFLQQNKESVNSLKQSGIIPLTDFELNIIENVKNVKPYHSEVFIMTPFGINTAARIVMDRFMYYLFTTAPDDKVKIKHYTDKGFTMEEAIKAVIRDDGQPHA